MTGVQTCALPISIVPARVPIVPARVPIVPARVPIVPTGAENKNTKMYYCDGCEIIKREEMMDVIGSLRCEASSLSAVIIRLIDNVR